MSFINVLLSPAGFSLHPPSDRIYFKNTFQDFSLWLNYQPYKRKVNVYENQTFFSDLFIGQWEASLFANHFLIYRRCWSVQKSVYQKVYKNIYLPFD